MALRAEERGREEGIHHLQGQIDAGKYITAYYPLEKTIDALESIGRQEGIKYAIMPEGVPEGKPTR